MTYTFVELPVPAASFDWIKKKMVEGGYSHRLGIDHLDMTHIALTRMTGFEFDGNEDASLHDVARAIMKKAFVAGFKSFSDGWVSGEAGFKEFDEEGKIAALLVDAFQRMRDELAANLEARDQEAHSIINRAAELLKPKIENASEVTVEGVLVRKEGVETTIYPGILSSARDVDGRLVLKVDLTDLKQDN